MSPRRAPWSGSRISATRGAGHLVGGRRPPRPSGNAAGAGLASLGSGTYFLRIFGVPAAAISHFTGQLAASAVAATTPIPAGLPLFLSAMGALGLLARRRKTAAG